MARKENKFRTNVELDADAMAVVIKIVEKASGDVAATETFPAAAIHESCKPKVSLYGYSKLLQDRASDVEIGPAKLEAMKAIAEQLGAGQWAKERKIGAVVTSPEVEALASLQQISIPAAQAALKAYPKEVRQQILAHDDVVAKAAEIRAAREEQDTPSLDAFVPAAEAAE